MVSLFVGDSVRKRNEKVVFYIISLSIETFKYQYITNEIQWKPLYMLRVSAEEQAPENQVYDVMNYAKERGIRLSRSLWRI